MAENNTNPSQHYLDSAKAEFNKLKALGDKAFAQSSISHITNSVNGISEVCLG